MRKQNHRGKMMNAFMILPFMILHFVFWLVEQLLKLADRQCRIAELSQRVQDVVTILVTALWGHHQTDEASRAAADVACQDLGRRLTGRRPSDSYFRACSKLADMVIDGGFEAIAECPRYELMMKYDNS